MKELCDLAENSSIIFGFNRIKMTTQTKVFIELSDIIGLRLECKACGCALSLGADKDGETVGIVLSANSPFMGKCPACGAPWTAAPNPAVMWDSDIKELFRKLRDLKKMEPGFGCSIALELAAPPSNP
jgi:hypothetical protein